MEGTTPESLLQNGLKILVLARSVPDSNLPFPLMQGAPDFAAFSWQLNPFDEVAVEAAIQLRQQFKDQHPDLPAEVVVVGNSSSAGIAAVERALSLGGDRALLLNTTDEKQAIATEQLVALIRDVSPHLVLLGRMALGEEKGELAGQLAGLLEWQLATAVSELAINEVSFNFLQRRITRSRHATMAMPAIVSAELDLAIPRYVTLPALVAAKRKPKQPYQTDTASAKNSLVATNWQQPPSRKTGQQVNSVQELICRLTEQGVQL
jgi:electron transfer flavoprotein beta subunit